MANGRITELTVTSSTAQGRITELGVTTVTSQGQITEMTVATAQPQGRITELGVASVPDAIGWLGVSGVWTQVRGFLGVDGVWVPVKRWGGETIIIDPPPDPDPPVGTTYGPVQFATVADARAFLGAPTSANYVQWDDDWTDQGLDQDLLTVFTSKLAANDILVLPERFDGNGVPIPYRIRSENGFMASGVASITGSTAAARIPIISNSRCWFEMARGRRGILGMGPGTVIEPTVSAFTRPAQPITQDTGITMAAYNAAGAKLQDLVGAQDALMRFDHVNAFCGNFVLRGRDFGGVAYSGIFCPEVVNVYFDAASRGHAGVPNGETGCINTNNVAVRYENIEVKTTDAAGNRVVTSPIMLNRNTGGTIRNVKLGRPRAGMMTFWRCTGSYTLTDVIVEGDNVSLNLEEGGPGFQLTWTGGSISTLGSYHIVGEASAGSKKLAFNNVTVSGGVASGTNGLALHFYGYPPGIPTQKRSDVTRNNGPLSFYGSYFIA